MIDAIIGAVIMVVATTSLVYSIEVAEKAFSQAGQYYFNDSERKLLEDYGLDENARQDFYDANIKIERSRMQWGGVIK